MINILHIIHSLGLGGAYRTLVGVSKYSSMTGDYKHTVTSLKPINPANAHFAELEGIEVLRWNNRNELNEIMAKADIVQFHFWNTPENYEFLKSELPDMRFALWLHIAGDKWPQIVIPELVDFSDYIICGSPYTYKRPVFMNLPPEERLYKVGMAYDGTDFERFKGFKKKPHDNFNVGFIGTPNFVKMHTEFVPMSAAVNIPDVKFIVCGMIQKEIFQQAEEMNATHRFDFRGYESDVQSVLEILDVFGYPLNEHNYACGELVLQEAMYVGIPPVVFPHSGPGDLVINDYTGIVVHSELEYSNAIEYLYHHPEERDRLGKNAMEYARQIFGAENAAMSVNPMYDHIMTMPKRKRTWPVESVSLKKPLGMNAFFPVKDKNPETVGARLFIESLGPEGLIFIDSINAADDVPEYVFESEEQIMRIPRVMSSSDTGGVVQYEAIYLNDPYLRLWAGLMWFGNKRYDIAVSEFQSAININLNHWRVYYYLALSYEKLSDIENARIALAKALESAPDCPRLLEVKKRLFGEIEDVQKILKESMKDIPKELYQKKEEGFNVKCPTCQDILYVLSKGRWQCPKCKNDFVV